MAPTMIAMLLEDPIADRYDLSSLTRIGYGASAMPARCCGAPGPAGPAWASPPGSA
jgi:hypothetical protein